MKVRFVGQNAEKEANSIRLRLRKTDVEKWRKIGQVTDQIVFPGGVWTVTLTNSDSEGIEASMSDGTLTIKWPKQEALAWLADDSQESLKDMVKFDIDKKLSILIERDGLCADGRDRDDLGVFREFGGSRS
jgi:hypothetical protein